MSGDQHRRLVVQAFEEYSQLIGQLNHCGTSASRNAASCVVDALTDHVLDVLATQERAEQELRARTRTVDCRDLFAAAALMGMLADGGNVGLEHEDPGARAQRCRWAWEYAHEMMKGRGGGDG